MRTRKIEAAPDETDALAALSILRAYVADDTATHTAARAALKTINAFARQRESEVRAEAKRLGVGRSELLARLLKSVSADDHGTVNRRSNDKTRVRTPRARTARAAQSRSRAYVRR